MKTWARERLCLASALYSYTPPNLEFTVNINLGFGFRCTKTHPMFPIASKVKSLKSDVCVQKTLRSSCCYISNYLNTETIGCIRTGYRYLFVRFIFLHTRQNTKHHTECRHHRQFEVGPTTLRNAGIWNKQIYGPSWDLRFEAMTVSHIVFFEALRRWQSHHCRRIFGYYHSVQLDWQF